jgi:spore maturation protein SpmA
MRKGHTYGWFGSVVVGLLFFFPSFLFSLPVTIIWARYTWPGDGQDVFGAIVVSFYIGIIGAIVCCAVLLRKRWRVSQLPKSQ